MALELSAADFGGARYARLQRSAGAVAPGRHSRDPRRLSRGRRRRRRNRLVHGLAAQARRVRPGRSHARDQSHAPPQLAREACDAFCDAGSAALRRRLDGPDRHADLVVGSVALEDHLRATARHLRRTGARAGRRRRRPAACSRRCKTCSNSKPRSRASCASSIAGLRRVPIQAQPTLITEGRMLLGTDIRAICATLDALPIDVIGLNCSTGPAQMRDSRALSVRELALFRQRDSQRRACR